MNTIEHLKSTKYCNATCHFAWRAKATASFFSLLVLAGLGRSTQLVGMSQAKPIKFGSCKMPNAHWAPTPGTWRGTSPSISHVSDMCWLRSFLQAILRSILNVEWGTNPEKTIQEDTDCCLWLILPHVGKWFSTPLCDECKIDHLDCLSDADAHLIFTFLHFSQLISTLFVPSFSWHSPQRFSIFFNSFALIFQLFFNYSHLFSPLPNSWTFFRDFSSQLLKLTQRSFHNRKLLRTASCCT